MSGKRPGFGTYLAFQFAGTPFLVVIIATWIAIGQTFHHAGAAAAVAVALAAGAVGWWVIFGLLEPRMERLAARWFGPREAAASQGWAAQLAWQHLSPLMKTWARAGWVFCVVAPIVQLLVHH
jgi:hypothetical protein